MNSCTLDRPKAGDWVVVDGFRSEVMFCSVSDTYASGFPKSDWPQEEYQGIMVREAEGGLIFYEARSFLGSAPTSLEWDEGNKPVG